MSRRQWRRMLVSYVILLAPIPCALIAARLTGSTIPLVIAWGLYAAWSLYGGIVAWSMILEWKRRPVVARPWLLGGSVTPRDSDSRDTKGAP